MSPYTKNSLVFILRQERDTDFFFFPTQSIFSVTDKSITQLQLHITGSQSQDYMQKYSCFISKKKM